MTPSHWDDSVITPMIHSYHQYHNILPGSIQILPVTGPSKWREMGRQAPAPNLRGATLQTVVFC
jgi:hypothetical protein